MICEWLWAAPRSFEIHAGPGDRRLRAGFYLTLDIDIRYHAQHGTNHGTPAGTLNLSFCVRSNSSRSTALVSRTASSR